MPSLQGSSHRRTLQTRLSLRANEPGTPPQPVAKARPAPPIEPVNRVSFSGCLSLSKTPSLERPPTHGLERDFEANGDQTTDVLPCDTPVATPSYLLKKSPSSLDRPPTPWHLLCVVNIPVVCLRLFLFDFISWLIMAGVTLV